MSTLRHERPAARHRWWSLVFGVAGVALVPWIVVLAVVQPRVAPVGDLALAAGGAMTVTTAGLLVSAALTRHPLAPPRHDVERHRDGRALHRLLPRRLGDREQPAGGRLRDPARGRPGRRALRPRRPPRRPATDLERRPAARPAVRPRRRRDGPGVGARRLGRVRRAVRPPSQARLGRARRRRGHGAPHDGRGAAVVPRPGPAGGRRLRGAAVLRRLVQRRRGRRGGAHQRGPDGVRVDPPGGRRLRGRRPGGAPPRRRGPGR